MHVLSGRTHRTPVVMGQCWGHTAYYSFAPDPPKERRENKKTANIETRRHELLIGARQTKITISLSADMCFFEYIFDFIEALVGDRSTQ